MANDPRPTLEYRTVERRAPVYRYVNPRVGIPLVIFGYLLVVIVMMILTDLGD